MVAAAGLEQREVAIDRGGAIALRAGGQLFHQLGARREAGGVLIHIVRRAVEVRNARPGQARLLVVIERVAVIDLHQVEIDLAEPLGGHRPSLLDQAMRLQLVVGEQHLRVERADDAVDRVLEKDDFLAVVGRAFEHVVEEQHLAERGRHLGHEDGVRRVDEGLMGVREERVHRVPHLVRQREDGIQRVVVVQQHVRVHTVHRCGIGAAPLARVLVDVDPLAGQTLAHLPLVLLP